MDGDVRATPSEQLYKQRSTLLEHGGVGGAARMRALIVGVFWRMSRSRDAHQQVPSACLPVYPPCSWPPSRSAALVHAPRFYCPPLVICRHPSPPPLLLLRLLLTT